MKKIILFSIFILVVACNKTNNQQNESPKKESQELKNILDEENSNKKEYTHYKDNKFDFNDKNLYKNLNKAINEGDTIAYKSASKYYIVNGRYKEFLYYAILMAEKNNYREAYWDISTILASESNEFTSQYGTYSLLKSYEMGEKNKATLYDKRQKNTNI